MGFSKYQVRPYKNMITFFFSFCVLHKLDMSSQIILIENVIFVSRTHSNIRRYSRLLSPRYGDGYSSPTISITGRELPNSRLVSLVAFGEADVPDPQFTLVNMQFGQIITHDMSMLAGSTQSSEFFFFFS